MKKLFTKFSNFAKNHPVVLSALLVAIVTPVAVWAWGPNRQTFMVEKPASFITFNSITNNPHIGDERNFVGIREKGSTGTWTDNMTAQAGKEYTIRLYVHNNANANLNLVAENVVAKFNLPTNTGKKIDVGGILSSSNATPNQIWDSASFSANEDFNIAYVPGSARFENNAIGKNGGVQLPDSIVTNTGAKLGYDKLDGRIPGCFQYAGYVSITVRAQFAPKPAPKSAISLQKTVKKKADAQFSESVKAVPGEEVLFQLHAKNVGNAKIDNLVLRDVLPKGLTYVAGSSRLYNATNPKGLAVKDDVVANSGINVGDYLPNGDAYLRFRAKVVENDNLPVCGTNTLTNLAQASNQKVVQNDTASVVVEKKCQNQAIRSCNAIIVNQLSRNKFEFNTSYTLKNYKFHGTRYIIRDSKQKIVHEKIVIGSDKATFESNLTGKFTVKAFILTDSNAQNAVTSANCQKDFEIKPEVKSELVCRMIAINKISRTKFEFNTSYVIKNNQFYGVRYIIVDTQGKTVSDKIVKNDTKFTFESNTTGKFTIKAIILTANGQESGAVCESNFIIEEPGVPVPPTPEPKTPTPPTPPTTPTVPKELPKTGSAEMISALVGLGSLTVAFAYYVASRKQLL